jgi:hypothetical protein
MATGKHGVVASTPFEKVFCYYYSVPFTNGEEKMNEDDKGTFSLISFQSSFVFVLFCFCFFRGFPSKQRLPKN